MTQRPRNTGRTFSLMAGLMALVGISPDQQSKANPPMKGGIFAPRSFGGGRGHRLGRGKPRPAGAKAKLTRDLCRKAHGSQSLIERNPRGKFATFDFIEESPSKSFMVRLAPGHWRPGPSA